MKRLLVLAGLSLAAAVVFAPSGSAQSGIATIVRGTPVQVTITTTPRRDRTRPYTFRTRGRVIPPPRYCAPGTNPGGLGPANCVPVACPPGTTNPSYCLVPGRRTICSGRVTVRYQQVSTTISSRTVPVRNDCSYRSSVTFRLRLPTRRGVLRVRARFQGNPVLLPRSSRTITVRAG